MGPSTFPDSVSESSRRCYWKLQTLCKMVAEDSLGRLDAMKTHQPSSIWAGVRQELNIMWTKDEVEALMKRVHIRA